MTRISEPLKKHIHDDICSEVNEMIIRLKIWDTNTLDDADDDQQKKILAARERHTYTTSQDVIELLTRVRDEMNQCTKPYILK